MENPLVSIIIPSYNHVKYVQKSIESVLKQSYQNIELIVIDDGSNDGSVQLLERLQKQHGFKLTCRENKGLCATLNEAISQQAHGKYIRCLASDDYYTENSVSDLVNYMEQNPDKALAFGWAQGIDPDGNFESEKIGKDLNPQDFSFKKLLEDNFIVAVAAMYKKEVWEEVGGFDNDIRIEDWDMWLKITYKYPIGYLNQQLAFYRYHPTNLSAQEHIMSPDRMKILKKWKGKIPQSTFNRIWSVYVFKHYRKLAGTNKKTAIKMLFQYKFQYLSVPILRDFLKGTFKLAFLWK